MRRNMLVAASACALLLLPSAASATTYCVAGPDPADCTGTAVNAGDFETMVLQGPQDGVADTAILDDGVYLGTDGYLADPGDPLTIVGSGDHATILTATAGSLHVLDTINGPAVTVRNLTVRITDAGFNPGSGVAVRSYADSFVDVVLETEIADVDAADRFSGSTLRDSVVRGIGASGAFSHGISNGTQPESFLIEDSTIDADNAVFVNEPGAPATIRRSTLRATSDNAATALGGAITIENSVIEGGSEAALLAQGSGGDAGTLTADHVTVISGATDAAVRAWVPGGEAGNASLVVRNSILRGSDHAYERQGGNPVDGEADLTIAFSDFTTGTSTDAGNGSLDTATGNVDADPKFVAADDFHLASDSPVIDAGDPAEGGLTGDFDMAPRPNDGNRDRTAIRDMGAFEFQAAPPDPLPGDPPPGGGGTTPPPLIPPNPILPPAATFGPQTLVTLTGLGLDRRGRVRIRVRNRNTFAITGAVAVNSIGAVPRAAVRLGRRTFTVAAGARKTVAVKLSKRARRALRKRRRLAVRLVGTVRAPSGTARTVRRRVTVRRAK